MIITPENLAKLIFLVSNLRYFEREYASDKEQDIKVEISIVRIKNEIDTFLKEMGLDEYFDKTILTEVIKINLESSKLKKAV